MLFPNRVKEQILLFNFRFREKVSNINVLTLSMKRLYCSEKKHEHWRFYCWGLGSPNPLRFLPVNILNPIHGLGVADFSKIPLGGGQVGVPEDDF